MEYINPLMKSFEKCYCMYIFFVLKESWRFDRSVRTDGHIARRNSL